MALAVPPFASMGTLAKHSARTLRRPGWARCAVACCLLDLPGMAVIAGSGRYIAYRERLDLAPPLPPDDGRGAPISASQHYLSRVQ